MAYAGAEFAAKILRAVNGEKGIVAPTYVSVAADTAGSAALTKELGEELAFFSSNVELGVCFQFTFPDAFCFLTRPAHGRPRVLPRSTPLATSLKLRKHLSRLLFLSWSRTSKLYVQSIYRSFVQLNLSNTFIDFRVSTSWQRCTRLKNLDSRF
jgi:hypothetical protein